MSFLIVAIGGALGAVLRYGVALIWGGAMATVLVNVVGSFIMGIAFVALSQRGALLPLFVLTGFCGGFTTFSAFSLDAMKFISDGSWGMAFLYIFGSVILSVLAIFAGVALARGVFA